MQPSRREDKKKPYSPPTLKVYGTVAQLTEAVGRRGKLDRGARPNNRTHA